MNISYKKLTSTKSFAKLSKLPRYKYDNFDTTRIADFDIAGAGYHYNFSTKQVDNTILSVLLELAEEQQIIDKYKALLNGEIVNTGENRMVLHHALRGKVINTVIKDGRDYHKFYKNVRNRIKEFAHQVHTAKIKSSSGAKFDTFVQIGIGGSDLGPRAIFLAMQQYVYAKDSTHPRFTTRFISNVDPDDMATQLQGCNPERTMFIVVSKSGTTQETLTNEALAVKWLQTSPKVKNPKKHIICVTSETSPLAQSTDYLDSFFIDDFIGGRYSVTSAVGVCILDLALGSKYTDEFLKGAHEADKTALNDFAHNPSAIDALIGVLERNVYKYNYTAILPYSQALSRFPAHLQQLDMESNGKQVTRDGKALNYSTGPVIFGEPGTNGQHSFYQHLHQGTDIVPLQFIGFQKSQIGKDIRFKGSSSQRKLNANLAAQIVAFALGQEHNNPHKVFKGLRPSSIIYAPCLTPKTLGAILAHFENKVMFQGFIWNINSFDQEGVQLGKLLTNEILKGTPSDVLQAYFDILKN